MHEHPALTQLVDSCTLHVCRPSMQDRSSTPCLKQASVRDFCLALQGILSKYNVSDADYEAIMKWKHDV